MFACMLNRSWGLLCCTDLAGLGPAQRWLLFVCGLANAADSVALAGISFLITTSCECDLELTDARKGSLISALFVGMMVGGMLWGSMADARGRQPALVFALGLNASAGLAVAMSVNYYQMVINVVLCGVGVGGSMPVVFSYMAEFMPPHARGRYLTLLAAIWMCGSIVAAAFAVLIISPNACQRDLTDTRPTDVICADHQSVSQCGTMQLVPGTLARTWRVYMAALTLLPIAAVALMVFCPESPRWLAAHGRTTEAKKVLMRVARSNNVKADLSSYYLVEQQLETLRFNRRGVDGNFAGLTRGVKRCWCLFQPPLRRNSLLLCGIWASLSFGFYGFTLWLPEFFRGGGVDDDTDIYLVSLIVATANLPGNVFAYFAVDRLGRKWTLWTSLSLSGIAVFFILGVKTTAGVTVFSSVFAAVSVSSWNVLDVMMVEYFPTHTRSTAFGVMAAVGRLASIFSSSVYGLLRETNPTLPIILTGAAFISAAATTFFLPGTSSASVIH